MHHRISATLVFLAHSYMHLPASCVTFLGSEFAANKVHLAGKSVAARRNAFPGGILATDCQGAKCCKKQLEATVWKLTLLAINLTTKLDPLKLCSLGASKLWSWPQGNKFLFFLLLADFYVGLEMIEPKTAQVEVEVSGHRLSLAYTLAKVTPSFTVVDVT